MITSDSCRARIDGLIQVIAKHCPLLTSLNVARCEGLNDFSFLTPRFPALTANIRERRGAKVDIRLPRFQDTNTPQGIVGAPPPATLEEALEPALALGVALQLTNILRDVGEDRARQRIYLPREDLVRFGVTEQALLKGVKDENYTNMLKFQIARAREWYDRAESGIPMLAEDARLPVRASLDMYSTILKKIEDNSYDNFNLRAYTPKWQKLLTVCNSWAKVQMQK
mgnify:CR=1 FL=1